MIVSTRSGSNTFGFTVSAAVSAFTSPIEITTDFPLWSTVRGVSFVGSAVIPNSSKSLNSTSFVKRWLSVNVTFNPVRSSVSPSV